MGVIWMRIIDGIMSQSSKLFGMCGGECGSESESWCFELACSFMLSKMWI